MGIFHNVAGWAWDFPRFWSIWSWEDERVGKSIKTPKKHSAGCKVSTNKGLSVPSIFQLQNLLNNFMMLYGSECSVANALGVVMRVVIKGCLAPLLFLNSP